MKRGEGDIFPQQKAAENWEGATEQEEVASGQRFGSTPVLHKGMNLQTAFMCVCSEYMHSFIEGENENDKSGALLTDCLFFRWNDPKIIDFSSQNHSSFKS